MDVYKGNLHLLKTAGVDNAAGELCELIAAATNESYESVRRAVILSSSGCSYAVSDPKVVAVLDGFIRRRLDGEPLQYITGETDFYGRSFLTAKNVLIPRFDTECVLEATVKALRNYYNPALCDLCCGSGCIGITAVLETGCRLTAVDVSDDALLLTKRNADRFGISLNPIKKDLLVEPLEGLYDVIVANPPYIPSDEIPTLSREVQNEPRLALDGGKDGLVFYRRLAKESYTHLKNGGTLVFEIGMGQRADLTDIVSENGYSEMCFFRDLGGIDRVVVCRKPEGKDRI